jgi:hypothetical protein
MERRESYDELSAYTLSRPDAVFTHQYVVDTWAVRSAALDERPIRIVQALVGLYLHVEHGATGREVQRVHKLLADRRPTWPVLDLPDQRGSVTVDDVLREPPGPARDHAIEEWAASTWSACRSLAPEIEAFLARHGITPPAR